jgi:uncharacterized protein (TIGR03083 family)
MRIADYIAVLGHDGRRLADAAEKAGPGAAVPTCPGWLVRDLLHHLGGVHRWAAATVSTGRAEPYDPGEHARFFTTEPDDTLVEWYRAAHRALVDTLSGADETTACWTFLPAPSPLAFWARRQAHETAIHRADAESAVSDRPEWTPAFAADGVDELFNGFFARPRGRLVADPARSLAVRATDADAAWTMHIEPEGRRVVAGADSADLTLTGPAGELYLLLWNRGGTDRIEVRGDRAVLDLWRERAQVRWR